MSLMKILFPCDKVSIPSKSANIPFRGADLHDRSTFRSQSVIYSCRERGTDCLGLHLRCEITKRKNEKGKESSLMFDPQGRTRGALRGGCVRTREISQKEGSDLSSFSFEPFHHGIICRIGESTVQTFLCMLIACESAREALRTVVECITKWLMDTLDSVSLSHEDL